MADNTFELYKLLVEEAREARRARRELSNIFLTLNVAGFGALGLVARDNGALDPALLPMLAFALALTCVIWGTSNAYYTKVLSAKYKIITEFENRLNEHPLRDEHLAMGGTKAMRAFTLERIMPMLFIIGYILFSLIQERDLIEPWAKQASDFIAAKWPDKP
jgi:hypothetical protein